SPPRISVGLLAAPIGSVSFQLSRLRIRPGRAQSIGPSWTPMSMPRRASVPGAASPLLRPEAYLSRFGPGPSSWAGPGAAPGAFGAASGAFGAAFGERAFGERASDELAALPPGIDDSSAVSGWLI